MMKKLVPAFFALLVLFSQVAFADDVPYCEKIGVYECGKWPKQVVFSLDEKYIIMPLLDDDGIDVFDMEKKAVTKRIRPPTGSEKEGFVECIFIPEKNTFFVSQMNTNKLHEFSAETLEFIRSIPTGGILPKFMAWSPEKSLVAVSNWISNDVSLIDYNTGKVVRKIEAAAAPRGIAFIKGGTELVSLAFDGGDIQKFSVETGKELGKISVENAAMRHIVVNEAETKAWVSNMYHRQVYEIDLATFKITKNMRIFNNPNTIGLLADRFVFASSRGPNDPVDYTRRSPQDGKISVIDTSDWTLLFEIQGGNQPTGLAISPSGKYLCFSNFQDHNIELYEIKWKPKN